MNKTGMHKFINFNHSLINDMRLKECFVHEIKAEDLT
jgi:hypothetical protein